MRKTSLWRRWISSTLCLSMVLSFFAGIPVYAAESGGTASGFSGSFEQSEALSLSAVAGATGVTAQGEPTITKFEDEFTNYAETDPVKITTTQPNKNDSEWIDKLIDRNTGTKFCTTGCKTLPMDIVFSFESAIAPKGYYISGANDDMSSQSRVLTEWKIYGSTNQTDWVELDHRSGVKWSSNEETQRFILDTRNTSYQYYKLQILKRDHNNPTASDGTMQFSGFGLAETVETQGESGTLKHLNATVTDGPRYNWGNKSGAWDGEKALHLEGTVTDSNAKSDIVLYDNLNIPVTANTRLSYMVFPDIGANYDNQTAYDYDYTSMYAAIDLEFDDKTRLSDLSAVDQYGTKVSPQAQGGSRIMATNNWLQINTKLGAVASGKTIKKVLASYANINAKQDKKISVYFDDVRIFDEADKTYENLADCVNILRGTYTEGNNPARGLNTPIVAVPYGFNYWAPVANSAGQSGEGHNVNAPYHYVGTVQAFQGIQISHVASNWIGTSGTYTFSADSTTTDYNANNVQNMGKRRTSDFRHENEIAKPYYYGVTLDSGQAPGVKVEVTPTEHAAVLRFTFPAGAAAANVVLDARANRGSAKMVYNNDGTFTTTAEDTKNGQQIMHIYGKFDKTPTAWHEGTEKGVGMFEFAQTQGQELVVELQVATSFISQEQAKQNWEEVNEKNFDAVKDEALAAWNEALGTIEVTGGSEHERVTFYSNLYRCFLYPTSMSETTADGKTVHANVYGGTTPTEGPFVYNNGFWDTFRTAWPLYSIMEPVKAGELLDGLVQHYLDNGWVPRWIAPGGSDCMVGTNSDNIFADALNRGIEFDVENAYASALRNGSVYVPTEGGSTSGRRYMEDQIFRGYVPQDGNGGGNWTSSFAFSWGLEGTGTDFAIAAMAKKLRDGVTDTNSTAWKKYNDEYLYFTSRALNYVNVFNESASANSTGWFRAKDADGNWLQTSEAFNPVAMGWGYCEDNAWNYAFPYHDGRGVANLYGIARNKDGRTALGEKLDEAYSAPNTADPGNWSGHKENWEGRETKQGQIHMDNQPAHHIPYMYLYTDQPWKTADWVRDTLDRLYVGEEIGQGYFGDEDNAEASAWYVLSALGLYPLTNGNGVTALGTPLFEKAVINRDDGSTVTITASGVSRENKYVRSVSVNGTAQTKTYLDADVLAKGKDATIAFTMGSQHSTTWGMAEDDMPPSITQDGSRPSPLVDLSDSAAVSAGADQALLHDNKVTTGAAGEEVVTYTFQTPVKVEMYTITSSDAGTAPTGWTLEGSGDGKTWTVLDARSGESFAWPIKPSTGGDKYTRPFAIAAEKQDSYSQYRLTFTDTKEIKVAELELLGNDKMDAERLTAEIEKIEAAYQETAYTTASWNKLQTVLTSAKAMAEKTNVTENEIRSALAQLQDAVSSLVPVKPAGEKIEAVSADELSSGVKKESTDGAAGVVSGKITNLGGIQNNSQAVYKGVRFAEGKSYTKMELTYAAKNSDVQNASVSVYLDKVEGTPIAEFTGINGTGSDWKDYVTKTATLTNTPIGDHDVYLVFHAGDKSHVMNLHALRFVESAPVTGVSVTVENATIKAGRTTQATAAVTPADADDTSVTWSSSDAAVATVNENGVVTGVAAGTAAITATSKMDGTTSGSCTVTVIEAQGSIPVTGVTVTPATTSVQVGKTRSLTATVAPANADNKTVTWSSSSETVATVDANGVVKGVAQGSATITATTADGSNKTAACQVTVTNSETPASSTLKSWDFVTENELPCASVSVNRDLTYGGNGAENANNLIDGSTATKLCATGGVTLPLEFVFSYETPVSAEKYFISGGNDDAGNPGRTLKTWKLYGSDSLQGTWTELDSQSNQTGWQNFEVRSFPLTNASYQYYKLEITQFNGTPGIIQFSGFGLLKAVEDGGQPVGTEDGKSGSVTMAVETKDGKLHVSGHHDGAQPASIGTVLYDGLNIPVTEKTRLVYNITPRQPLANNLYDYDFYSMHLAVDLKFTDETYLSKLDLEDENRVLADPNSQGEGKAMLYAQENQITIPLGSLTGKTIESVLIRYANDADLKSAGSDYKADLDYIKLVEAEPLNYGKDSLVDYAYILRGTNNFGGAFFSRGLTGPMVAVPHGFNFWAPETSTGNTMFDYRAGYINGFRCSHEPSIWVGDRGVWRFMPGVGNASGICTYSLDNVVARPYYFSVQFDEKAASPANGIQVELSPTDHGQITRLSYPSGAGSAYVDIKDLSGLTFDAASKSFQGYKNADSNQMPKMYVYGTFDQPFTVSGSRVTFTGGRIVEMRAATSFISAAQARSNYDQELAGKDLDTIKASAKKLWNDKLSAIEIEGATEEQRIAFYSNLYRLYLYPNNMGEQTGQGTANGWQYMSPYTKQVEDGKLYYNNGFWDTYRTTWAAYSLLTPAQNNEMLAGLIRHYQDSNWMPRWIAPAGTNSMVGTSSDVIFGDAIMRGAELTDEQWQLAYQSALKNASMSTFAGADGGRDGIDKGLFLGYTPGGSQKFSWSIEGYINDFGIANLAKALHDEDAYVYYLSRATNYVNLFRDDGDGVGSKWLAAKNEDGTWTRGTINIFAFHDDYTETTPLNMACSVPQDGQGLANLYGGRAALAEKLDTLFETTLAEDCVGADHGIHERKEAQEVKMGEYGHSNQPSHHIPYMYLYAGRPDKTQEKVRQVLRQCYVGSRIGQGYIGDEDNGEMSAWYILSAMGVYPVNMGSGELAFGSPLFTKVTIHHENGHDLVFSAPDNSRENIYVNGVTINGTAYNKTSILQTALTDRLSSEDVTVKFQMQSIPGTWGTTEDSLPSSITTGTEAPDPLKDRLETGAAELTAMPEGNVTAASIYSPNVQSGVALNQLLDNNSKTSVAFNPTDGKVEIYYFGAASMPVELYTITDAGNKATAPAKFQLYGSNDNQNWTALDSRENIVFDWGTFTKPFLTDDASTRYRSFKLVIETNSKVEIAELELMSRTASMMNAGALGEQIAAAAALQKTLEQQSLKNLLGGAIQAAQAVADKGTGASAAEIAQAVEDLQTAMADIPALSRMWDLLDEAKALTGFDPAYQKKVEQVIADASALAGDPNATEDQLRQMISRLETVLEMVTHTPRDGFAKIEAEGFDGKHSDIVNDGNNIGGVKPNTWVKYNSVNFSGKAGRIQVNYAAQQRDAGGTIQVRLDALDGPVIAELEAPVTGTGWSTYVTIEGILNEYVEGVYDVYLCFVGTNAYVANVDWFQFDPLTVENPVTGIEVFKDSVKVEEDTVLKVYTNEDHAQHSLTLTAQVEPENATNQDVDWTRVEVTGKVTLVRNGNQLTVTAVHDEAETNVGVVTLEVTAVADPSVKRTIEIQVIRMLENPVSISIHGAENPETAPKFGQTLEADVNQLKMTDAGKAALKYQWKRNGSAISGATEKTYTLTEADVGAKISVDVTADPATYYEGTRSAERAQAVVKADGPSIPGSKIYGVAPTTADNNDGKIVGFGDEYAKYEYTAKDADAWTAVESAEVTGLENGEYQVRIMETTTHEAGPAINVTVPAYGAVVYKINIDPNMEHGTVTRSVGQAEEGTQIELTGKPDTGYELSSLTVTGPDNTGETTVTDNEDGTYSFTMPAGNVTVSAEFTKLRFTITHELEHLKCSLGTNDSHEVEYGDTAAITLKPEEGYGLPARDTIKITNAAGNTITGWSINDQGVITITGGVTSNLTIKASGVAKTYVVNYTLKNGLSAPEADAPRKVNHKAAYTGTLVAASGYNLPARDSITVTMGGEAFDDFTYEDGTLTIAEGKITGNLVITASGIPSVSGVTLDQSEVTLNVNETTTLRATVLPANAADKTVTWKSSDENVATVKDGLVTAKAAGEATITVTTNDGSKKATCLIHVNKPAPGEIVVSAADVNVKYDGQPHSITVTVTTPVTGASVKYATAQDGDYTAENPAFTEVGTYTVYFKITAEGYTEKTGSAKVVITKDEPPVVDTVALKAAITAATKAKEGVVVGTTAADVAKDTKFVTQAEMDALNAAIADAQAVADKAGASQAEVDTALTTLNEAVKTFNADIKTGSYTPVTPSTPSKPSTPPVTTSKSEEGGASTTETTAKPAAVNKDGVASSTVSISTGNEIVKQAEANKSENVVIAPEVKGDVSKTEVAIPAKTVEQIGSKTAANLTVSTPVANVTIPNEALSSLSQSGATVKVAAERTGNTVELSIMAGSKTVDSIPGGVQVVVPVEETKPGTVAVLVSEDGTRTVIRKSLADDGSVTIPLEGSAKIEILDNSKKFDDVPEDNWAAGAVAFVSARELFNGTGETTFSPDLPMSRGMLAVVLHNLENNPAQSLSSTFTDVDSGKWYAEGISWAAEKGIITGYGNSKFGPDDEITREQLVVMLWRYAGSPAPAGKELNFTDGAEASDWAQKALCWTVEKGIINGKGNGILDPTGKATRAETAQMLKNFLEKQ